MNNNMNECNDDMTKKAIVDPAVSDIINEVVEAVVQKKMEDYILQQRRKSTWPFTFAGLALISWIVPFIGLPVAITAIVSGWRARRADVSAIGIIGLALTCITTAYFITVCC